MALQEFLLPSGGTLLVETEYDVRSARPTRSGAAGRQRRSVAPPELPTLDPEKLVNTIASFIDGAAVRLRSATNKPSELEFAIGIKIGVEGGFIVAKGSAEANINLTVKYTDLFKP